MAGDYNAGSAYLTVRPRLAVDFTTKLRADLARVNQTLQIRVTADTTGVRREVATAVRSINERIQVKVSADTTRLRRELATATRDVSLTVNLTTDFAAFRARLEAQLARIRPTITVRLDVDRTMLTRLQTLLGNNNGNNGNIFGNVGSPQQVTGFTSSILKATTAIFSFKVAIIALVATALIPLAAVVTQAVGSLALLPGILAGIGAAAGTVAIGMQGITKAFEAGTKLSEASSDPKTIAANAKAAETAATNLSDAYYNAAKTQQDGTRAVADAQYDEVQSVKSLRSAQRDLNSTRKDAKRTIDDMNLALRGSKISEREAVLTLAQAKRDLAQLRTSDPLERESAVLRVEEAEQRILEVRLRNQQLSEDAADANSKGVEGADSVVAAKDRVADAERGVQKAAENTARAQEDSARANILAARQITDSLKGIQEAQDSANEAATAYQKALDDLAPAAADFVEKVRGLSGVWTDFRKTIQQKLFEGTGDSISELANKALPHLKDSFADIAEVINGRVKSAFEWLAQDDTLALFDKILENAAEALGPFLDGLGNLVQGLLNLAGVGSEFLPDMASNFADITEKFKEWAGSSEGQERFRDFLKDSLEALEKVWNFVAALGHAIGALFQTAEPTGMSWFQTMTDRLQKWADWLESEQGQAKMKEFWDNLTESLGAIGQAAQNLGPVLDGLNTTFGYLADGMTYVADSLNFLISVFNLDAPGIMSGWAELWKDMGYPMAGFLDDLREFTNGVADGMADALNALVTPVNLMIKAWNALAGLVGLDPADEIKFDFTPNNNGGLSRNKAPSGKLGVGSRAGAGFADGGSPWVGQVKGPGSRRSDSLDTWLSRDEHVWSAEEVDGAGGHSGVAKLREMALRNARYPGSLERKDGGAITEREQAQLGGAPIASSLWAYVKNAFPNAVLNSAKTDHDDDGGYHPKGMAIDIGGPMQQVAEYLYASRSKGIGQIIWNPMPSYYNLGGVEASGAAARGIYGEDTMAGHGDHVHAMAKQVMDLFGGVVASGDSDGAQDSVWDKISDKASDAGSAATSAARNQVANQFEKLVQSFSSTIPPQVGKTKFGVIPKLAFDKLGAAAVAKVRGRVQSLVGAADLDGAGSTLSPNYDSSAGVEQWHGLAVASMRKYGFNADDPAQVAAMMSQISSESGGVPNIVQGVQDVNSGGNEAVGLLQVTPGTFAAYRDPALPNNRNNPEANMAAALRYYKARYGDDLTQQWGHQHGYDQGGVWKSGTYGFNKSGKPEAVLKNDEWQLLKKVAQNVTPAPKAIDPTSPSNVPAESVGVAQNLTGRTDVPTVEDAFKNNIGKFADAGMAFLTGQFESFTSSIGAPNPLQSGQINAVADYVKQLADGGFLGGQATDGTDYLAQAQAFNDPSAPGPGFSSDTYNTTNINITTRDVDEAYRKAQALKDLAALQYTARPMR